MLSRPALLSVVVGWLALPRATKEQRAEDQRRWRDANLERAREIERASYARNRERVKARVAAYREAHRDVILARRRVSESGEPFNAVRRMKRRGRLPHSSYVRRTILERDQWTCQLCGEPIDPALRPPDRMSAAIDHVVPIVKGGANTPDNVQAAHLVCNSRKGGR